MSDVNCPYCEKEVDLSHITIESDEFDYECPHCGKEFEVNVSYTPDFESSKIEYYTCECCKKEVRGICKKGNIYPFPKGNYKLICRGCYYNLMAEEYKVGAK